MIGVVVAMNNEAETLLSQMNVFKKQIFLKKAVYTGEFEGQDLVVIVSGIGKVNAAISTQFLIDNFKAEKILNFGLAGGLGKKIEIGDIFFVEKCVQYDFDLSLINNVEIGRLEEFDSKYIPCAPVKESVFSYKTLATGDRFNESKEDELLLINEMQADLKDMEGAAIAQTAALNSVELYMVKAVSDLVEKDSITTYFEKSSYALEKLKERMVDIFKVVIE